MKIFNLILLLALGFQCLAQKPLINPKTGKPYTLVLKRPDAEDIYAGNIIALKDKDYIEEKIIKGNEAQRIYGTRAMFELSFKPGTKFLPLTTVMKKLNIYNEATQKMNVKVDGYRYWNFSIDDCLTTQTTIKQISVSVDSFTSEKFLDIRTGAPMNKYKGKEEIIN